MYELFWFALGCGFTVVILFLAAWFGLAHSPLDADTHYVD